MKKIIMLIGILALQACIQRPFAEAYLEKSLKETIAENYEELSQEKKACIDEPTTASTENKLFFQYGMTSYDYCRIYEKTPEYKKFKTLQDKKNQQKVEMAKENEFRKDSLCSLVYDTYTENKNAPTPFTIYKKILEKGISQAKDKKEKQNELKEALNKFQSLSAQRAEMSYLINDLKRDCIDGKESRWSNVIKEYTNKVKSYYEAEERKIIAIRTGGKKYCPAWSSDYLLMFNQETPDKNCIYFIPQRSVQAFQVTKNGILASYNLLIHYGQSISFYFHKNKQLNNIVDGSYISGLFVYTGPYSYQSLTGQRTLHSFKALNKDILLKDIYFL